MHASAYRFLWTTAGILPPRLRVCEFGSRHVNGEVRSLFPLAERYVGIDLVAGPGVDIVADAASWSSPDGITFDTVVCAEVLEHADDGAGICRNAHRILERGGVLLVTAAANPRKPHSSDGVPLRPGEHYANVSEADLREWLAPFAQRLVETGYAGDVYALSVK